MAKVKNEPASSNEQVIEKKDTIQEEKKEKKHEKKVDKKPKVKTYSQEDINKIADELLKIRTERDQYLDMAQRQKAEFDNFRKRSETQRFEANGNGARDCIAAILPVMDNLQRAITQCEDVTDDDPLKQGVMMVFKQLDETLACQGLTKIEALGEKFDPTFHHAVVEGEATDDYPVGTVMEVLQDGYIVKEKIIRYAMVKVAK